MTDDDPSAAEEAERLAGGEYLGRARIDVVRGSLWTAFTAVVTLPLTFVASVFIARSLGPDGLGHFATYAAAFTVVSAIANLGWSEATVQWLASASATGRERDRFVLIQRCAGYHLAVGGPAAATTAFLLLLSSGGTLALVAGALAWATQIVGTSTVVLTASARNATSAQIALVGSTVMQLAAVTAAVASHNAALTWTVFLGVGFVGPALAVFALQPSDRQALFHPRLSLRMPKGFVAYALSACAAALVAILVFGRSEIFILRAHDLVAAAGMFAVVTGLASQLTGPLDSMLAPLTPIAAGIYAVDTNRAVRAFMRSVRVSAALGTAAACMIVPVGVTVLEPFYGAKYTAATLPFLVLGLASCVQTVAGPVAAFAFATRSAGQVLKANLICLCVDAVLAISLIPVIGLWGAVTANAVAQVASLMLLTRVVSRKLRVPVPAIIDAASLFGVGLLLGLTESMFCSVLDGTERLLAPLIIAVGMGCLWMTLRLSPSLQLAEEDMVLIASGSSNKAVLIVITLLRHLKIVRTRIVPSERLP